MSNQFEAPETRSTSHYDPELDGTTVQRGLGRARVVAVAMLLVGLMDGAAMLQILLFAYRQQAELVCGEVAFAGLGVALIATGARVYDGSFPAAVVGAALAAFGSLFAGFWFLFLLFWGGALSPIALFVCPASALAAVGCAVLAPTSRAVGAARARLVEP